MCRHAHRHAYRHLVQVIEKATREAAAANAAAEAAAREISANAATAAAERREEQLNAEAAKLRDKIDLLEKQSGGAEGIGAHELAELHADLERHKLDAAEAQKALGAALKQLAEAAEAKAVQLDDETAKAPQPTQETLPLMDEPKAVTCDIDVQTEGLLQDDGKLKDEVDSQRAEIEKLNCVIGSLSTELETMSADKTVMEAALQTSEDEKRRLELLSSADKQHLAELSAKLQESTDRLLRSEHERDTASNERHELKLEHESVLKQKVELAALQKELNAEKRKLNEQLRTQSRKMNETLQLNEEHKVCCPPHTVITIFWPPESPKAHPAKTCL